LRRPRGGLTLSPTGGPRLPEVVAGFGTVGELEMAAKE
jgi:hypothetical protein